jgi:hypothetical protein
LLAIGCLLGLVAPLAAQDKPTADQQKALTGTWTFDQSQSDTVSVGALRGLRTSSGFGGGMAGGGASAGGGGGGGRGGHQGGSKAPAQPVVDSGADSLQAQRDNAYTARALRDPHLALVLTDMNPGAHLAFAVNDSAVTLADGNGHTSSFRTDGRKHEQAQMDGSIIVTQALWNGGTLEITRGVIGTALLKREFKPGKDGRTLEVKETVQAGSGKVQKKLVFERQ